MGKLYHANLNQKNVRVAILLSGKVGVKVKIITRGRVGHCIIIMEFTHQESLIYE